ncbi:two-component system phosphate regulon sensor histidine kinase PhoR [Mesocricetibacter intestinalis]|uniref:Phosphate regulon sensor protein PhoR n=1 Tax=Mesocricetibacter intestinalis TaxID=1521930 RepID=A0A4R6VE98_9PAST|nr:phosphate regulon sensor histidine kinase PhoR [Mesocricetibacter intestinalis]TDQ59074.1 two-component system phosphate regulon sensor histidine kinase PhoR [Mesocricetibacter intestinalis]
MKFKFSYKHFLLEIIAAVAVALLFGYFAKSFEFWFIVILILLLIWHHNNEYSLLQLLNPKAEGKKILTPWDNFSQTVAFSKKKTKKDKIKALRLLSKLNRNIQYLPDGVIICSREGEISWCNNAAQELFSFYWSKKVSKNIFSVIFYPEFKNYFHQSKHQRPLVIITHEKRYVEINISLYDSDSLMIICRDVTQMISLISSRQTFLANMNHELRTPLTVLQGYLEILEFDSQSGELHKKAIEAMREQTLRMANLLQQLNILAKIEGSNNLEHQEVNMSELINSLQKSTALLNENDHHIHFDIEPEIKVWGDENQLQSAVSNLIFNAIKHSGAGSEIQISWKACEKGAKFSVKDNGVGIDEAHLPHLTERFYRVDESRSNATGGSGLGLAIVKHALEQHGTCLNIESEPGQGSEFSFVLKTKH